MKTILEVDDDKPLRVGALVKDLGAIIQKAAIAFIERLVIIPSFPIYTPSRIPIRGGVAILDRRLNKHSVVGRIYR